MANGAVSMIVAMAAVLATWLCWVIAFVGIGLVLQRLVGVGRAGARAQTFRTAARGPGEGERVLLAMWSGFGFVVLVLQLWNFLRPIDFTLAAALLVLGLGGFAVMGRGALGAIAIGASRSRGVAFLVIGLLVWLSNRSLGPGNAHDSGFYHFNVVRWANEYPVVPGLANLGSHLALNSSSLLFSALMNTGPWEGRGHHVMGGLVIAMLFLASGWGLARLIGGATNEDDGADRDLRPMWIYLVMLAVPGVMMGVAKDASSPKTDLAPGLVLFVVGGWFIAMLRRAGLADSDDPAARAYVAIFLTGMCALAVCLKLSTGVVALLSWVLVAYVYFARERGRADAGGWSRGARVLAVAAAISTLLVGSWMARNVVMSGYLLYPSTAIAVPGTWIDWRASEGPMRDLSRSVAMHPKGELPLFMYSALKDSGLKWYAPLVKPPFDDHLQIQGWEWLRPWFFSLPLTSAIEIVMPLCLSVVTLVCMAALKNRRSAGSMSWALLWFVPVVVGLIAWFFMSPGPRFGYPMAWMLAAGLAAVAVERRCGADWAQWRRWGLRAGATAAVLTIPVLAMRAAIVWKVEHANPLRHVPFVWPGPDRGFHPNPTRELETVTTRWGVDVLVPKGWNTGEGARVVWDCPLPALAFPDVDPDLRLRREGDLSAGFKIDRSGRQGVP